VSSAAERARLISLCKDLVVGQGLISARDNALLTAECNTNWTAAEHQLSAAAKRGITAHNTAQCRQATQQAGSASGLPAAAVATLTHALAVGCGNPATISHGTGLKSLQAQLCQEIVKAQVPAAAQQQALAACPKS
jgi:hypothetical protein